MFGVHIEGAVNRCPILGETGIKSTVSGPESFTPDHKPLLGNFHLYSSDIAQIFIEDFFLFIFF